MPALRHHPRRLDPWLLVAALLALIPLAALLQPGLPATADGQVHILRTLEVARLLRDGVWYPRWAPDFYLGYGYPFFNFYAPGAHLAAALLALAGLGVVRGVAALQALALVLYPIGAYLAVRSVLPADRAAAHAWRGPAALVGAAVYLYAPLRFRELFVQGNLSQWLALALLPWCAWLLVAVARSGGLGRTFAAALLLAALLYAHHPSAFLAWPALLVFALAVTWSAGRGPVGKAGRRTHVCAVLAAFLLAAALAAPFWLPSIVEMRDVNLNAIATGSFSAALNLLPWRELLALPALQDAAALNPPMPNSLGILQALLAAAGTVVAAGWLAGRRAAPVALPVPEDVPPQDAAEAWSPRQAGLVLSAVAALLLASLLLMLPAAAPAWDALPLARFIAFPWRLLGPALLWSALLSGAALYAVPARGRLPALALLLILVPAGVAPYLFPRPFAPAPEPGLASIRSYELSGGARATASANEYLPRWVSDAQPPELPQDGPGIDLAALPDGSRAALVQARGLDYRYDLELPGRADVLVQRFYFPGWQAWVDGQPAGIQPAGPYGLLAVSVPAGRHALRVVFGGTPVRSAAGALALAGLVAVGLLAAAGWLRRPRGPAHVSRDHLAGLTAYNDRALLAAALVILGLTVLKLAVIGPYTTWFRRQSMPDRPAGMQHAVNARFANGVELIGYDLPRPEVRQGQTLDVRLYWRTWAPKAADARPFLHLDAPTGEVTWANQTKLNAGDKPMAAWPPGFFVVDDYRLPVDAATPPVVGQLRVGLLGPGGELVPLANGGEMAGLGPARVNEAAPMQAASLPNHAQSYQLGPAIRLVGHEVRPLADGSGIAVTFYWQATATVPADYTAFVHVRDAAGQTVGQQDRPPVHGWYPTSAWRPGQVISDTHTVPLPPGALARDLDVAAGLYTPVDGQRAPVTDASGVRQPDDEIILPIKQD